MDILAEFSASAFDTRLESAASWPRSARRSLGSSSSAWQSPCGLSQAPPSALVPFTSHLEVPASGTLI